MKNIWIIAKRELNGFFDSLVGYILLVAFLLATGYFTWFYDGNMFVSGQVNLGLFFFIAYWAFLFFIPALSMRSLAEEIRGGTLEVVLTRDVTDWQLVVGKYLGCLLMILLALGFTLPFYIGASMLGPVDHGAIWGGYLALLLLSSAYIGIGIFASSLSNNQIVAFLMSLVMVFCFHLIFGIMGNSASGLAAKVLNFFSAQMHFESMSRGVIDSRDFIFFISITFLGLILAERKLLKRNVLRSA